jgi:hypothetical protein
MVILIRSYYAAMFTEPGYLKKHLIDPTKNGNEQTLNDLILHLSGGGLFDRQHFCTTCMVRYN